MNVTLTVQGLDDLLRDLNVPLEPVLQKITFAVGTRVRDVIATGPGPAHSPVIWASEKSRRYYFWLRREKGLNLNYSRGNDPMSQKLEQRWTVAYLGQTDSVVSNPATYGPFVQAEGFQTAQHKATGWITDAKAVAKVEASGDIVRDAEDIIAKQTAFKD